MPRRLALFCVTLPFLVLGGCVTPEPTAIIQPIVLTVEPPTGATASGVLRYRFAISLVAGRTVWFPGCAGIVRPDVRILVGGVAVDSLRRTPCADGSPVRPVRVDAGTGYAGADSVPVIAGATYVPYLGFSELGAESTPYNGLVTGPSFAAP